MQGVIQASLFLFESIFECLMCAKHRLPQFILTVTMRGGHIMPTCREEKTQVEQCAQGHIAEKMQSQELECLHAKWLQSCLTLCNPMDCSPPGSSVYGIL